MFDDVQGQNQQTPDNKLNSAVNNNISLESEKKAEPVSAIEDMFAETDQKEKPPAFQKKPEIDFDNQVPTNENQPSHQKIFFLVFLVLALILASVGGYWGYRYLVGKFASNVAEGITPEANKSNVSDLQNNASVVNNETEQKNGTQTNSEFSGIINNDEAPIGLEGESGGNQENEVVLPADVVEDNDDTLDSDGDGLTDNEEWRLGTAVDNVDTDNDGLFDREEVRVYKTNPKIADSDGDGFSDGDEIKSGYNPLGSGKLFDVNK